MLTHLSIENFKSFMEKAEIDLRATGYEILNETNKTKDNILKGALFVGGNATGKSTVLSAIRFLLELLVWQVNTDPFDYICLFKNSRNNMKLKYTFSIQNVTIDYEIECSPGGIFNETLWINNQERLVRIKNNSYYINGEQNKISIDNLQSNQSALRKVYFDTKFIDDIALKSWFEFLENSIYIDQYNKVINKATASSVVTYRDYFEKHGTKSFNQFLKDIGCLQYVEYTENYTNGKVKLKSRDGKKEVLMKRLDMDLALPIYMESTGNQTMINMLPTFYEALNESSMILIDEFSSGFHNVLEENLIRYFMKHSQNSQLFIVSHSTNLLSNSLLRPDQIYTVDFIKNKGSRLNRVSDSKPREAQNIEKMYLSGVFNGVPNSK